jgi:hypothetical protein
LPAALAQAIAVVWPILTTQRKNKAGGRDQGLVQDPVAADVAQGDAARLVPAEVVGGDWPGAQRAELVTLEYVGLPVPPWVQGD